MQYKKAIRSFLCTTIRGLNRYVRALSRFTHHMQHRLEWECGAPPEWYDHYLDVHWSWPTTGISFPWERGIFSALGMKPGATVLELCCGDGFNAHHFYAVHAKSIRAVDIDPVAIASARNNFVNDKISYEVLDIMQNFPSGAYTNIVWDAAIEHFTQQQMDVILRQIFASLDNEGIFSGYTIVERSEGKGHSEHEYEFQSKEDLFALLQRYFPNVRVFETTYPTRHNLYFFASKGGALPFDENWPNAIASQKL